MLVLLLILLSAIPQLLGLLFPFNLVGSKLVAHVENLRFEALLSLDFRLNVQQRYPIRNLLVFLALLVSMRHQTDF